MAKVHDCGIGELGFIVGDDGTLQPEHAHDFLPVEEENSFCCNLGVILCLYSLFEIFESYKSKISTSHGPEGMILECPPLVVKIPW